MLSDFIAAMISRLSAAGAPVYQADCVPPGTACPYITLAAVSPLGDVQGALTLTVWHTDNAGRIALADRLAALLPEEGLHLRLPSGSVILTGGTCAFLSEAPLLGIRMVWKLRFYPAG